MLTIIVQPPAGIAVPLAIVMLPLPAAAVTFAQVPVLPAVLIVIAPGEVGSVSVKTALVVIGTPFALLIVIVRDVLPFELKLAAPNALLTPWRIHIVWLAVLLAGTESVRNVNGSAT
ncbi:MAG: hypothetical protein H0V63_15335, partial [Burkholderiaceae bacterium]|nr:hypothetical protein [Burkholderiaceae bacterium]